MSVCRCRPVSPWPLPPFAIHGKIFNGLSMTPASVRAFLAAEVSPWHTKWASLCLRPQGINILFSPFGQSPERPPGRGIRPWTITRLPASGSGVVAPCMRRTPTPTGGPIEAPIEPARKDQSAQGSSWAYFFALFLLESRGTRAPSTGGNAPDQTEAGGDPKPKGRMARRLCLQWDVARLFLSILSEADLGKERGWADSSLSFCAIQRAGLSPPGPFLVRFRRRNGIRILGKCDDASVSSPDSIDPASPQP